MPLSARIKRIVSTITNQPPPYDPDVDVEVGATSGKKYRIVEDPTRRTSRGSISFDETKRPSSEYRVGRPTSPPMSATANPRSVSPATINAALSDAGVRGGSIASVGSGGSGESGEGSEEGDGEGATNMVGMDGTGRRGSAGVVNGQVLPVRKNSLTQRMVKPDGLRCQICKEFLTYDSGHKLNPLDNGLFCRICVSASRHTDPKSFTSYSLDPSSASSATPADRKSSTADRRKSSTGSGKANGLTKSNSLSDTGPMPDPNVLFDLKIVRPYHLGGYFPVKCAKCKDSFEICHDRYAGARCTVCHDPVWDLCGTCLAKAENGAYLQLLKHKEAAHADFGKDVKEQEETKVDANGVAEEDDDDDEDIDPMDESHMAKGTNGEVAKKEAEGEGGRKVMEWILYQPPGRIIGPAWRVAAMRNSV